METKELYNLFEKKYQEEVKPYIESRVPRNRFTEPVYYILDNFNLRRFRASFPLIFAESYNQNKDLVLPIGAASELIFTIALVQDDIIDHDNKRGDIPASHVKFGEEVCIASADYTYAYITKMLSELSGQLIPRRISSKIADNFIKAHERLYQSFMLEKMEAGNLELSKEEILEIYKDKTIQGTNSLECASLICTQDESLAEVIKNYSYNLAIAGQIKNDIYDATSYLENRGYSDLENDYTTYVIRKLIDSVDEQERERVLSIIRDNDELEIIKLLKDKKILQSCLEDCNKYVELALSDIRGRFPTKLEEILLSWGEGNRKFSRKI